MFGKDNVFLSYNKADGNVANPSCLMSDPLLRDTQCLHTGNVGDKPFNF